VITTNVVVLALAVALVIVGAMTWTVLSRRRRSARLHEQFGAEYDLAVLAAGGKREAQRELEGRRKHVEDLHIQPLSIAERERYLAEWRSVQSKFVDEPGQAIVDADRLIMEVMRLRAYPVSEFDQRAADISISYPALVSNYRAARAIAIKNAQHQADTEELRQALIHYRSLFAELVETEAVVVVEEKKRGTDRLVPRAVLSEPISAPPAR
jgi:hypothetical protein